MENLSHQDNEVQQEASFTPNHDIDHCNTPLFTQGVKHFGPINQEGRWQELLSHFELHCAILVSLLFIY